MNYRASAERTGIALVEASGSVHLIRLRVYEKVLKSIGIAFRQASGSIYLSRRRDHEKVLGRRVRAFLFCIVVACMVVLPKVSYTIFETSL